MVDSPDPRPLQGIETLYDEFSRIYPDQPNPLQATALLKYWLGGPDPLDYVSMYSNPGNPELDVPPHWHYISLGLSDLHGDGRVHEVCTNPDEPSGFGFELTFRLKKDVSETEPPSWPANLLQSLAKYVFLSGNVFKIGDHVSWNGALDSSESLIQHMLIDIDPQLGKVSTPCGTVDFLQIVGVSYEEMKAAQKWKGKGVLGLLKHIPNNGCGGIWLVTDMRRGESLFQLDPSAGQLVDTGIEKDGSNLSSVTAICSWTDNGENKSSGGFDSSNESEETGGNDNGNSSEGQSSGAGHESRELMPLKVLESVHLTFNLESGCLLPLAVRGRLKHGRNFTIKSAKNATSVTFVAESVTGAFVDVDKPYVSQGHWVQILVNEELGNMMLEKLHPLVNNPLQVELPKTYTWEDKKLSITIIPNLVSA